MLINAIGNRNVEKWYHKIKWIEWAQMVSMAPFTHTTAEFRSSKRDWLSLSASSWNYIHQHHQHHHRLLSSSYCWWTKSCTTKDDDYPIIYRVLTCFNHPRWCRISSTNSIGKSKTYAHVLQNLFLGSDQSANSCCMASNLTHGKG